MVERANKGKGGLLAILTFEQAVSALLSEQVVALPTETVYGLGGVATSVAAIERIYEVKQRPRDNPLICHCYDATQLLSYVEAVPVYWRHLVAAFSPGPVSYRLALPTGSPLTPALAGQSTVVFRIPDQPLCLEVIRQVNLPVAAPSANTSGKVSPTSAQMVEDDLGARIAGVLDGGPSGYGLESTILDCCEVGHITILRPGAIGPEEIEAVLRQAGLAEITVGYAQGAQLGVVPGSKYRHYAPDKTLLRIKSLATLPEDKPSLVLVTQERADRLIWPVYATPVVLGSRDDLPGVARGLYQQIKALDGLAGEAYYIEEDWGDSSLGRAITNRLQRASVFIR